MKIVLASLAAIAIASVFTAPEPAQTGSSAAPGFTFSVHLALS